MKRSNISSSTSEHILLEEKLQHCVNPPGKSRTTPVGGNHLTFFRINLKIILVCLILGDNLPKCFGSKGAKHYFVAESNSKGLCVSHNGNAVDKRSIVHTFCDWTQV